MIMHHVMGRVFPLVVGPASRVTGFLPRDIGETRPGAETLPFYAQTTNLLIHGAQG